MSQNQVGICEWVFPEKGADVLRHAARLGYDGVQIAERGGFESGDLLLNPAVQQEYYAAMQDTGVQIQALHLWSLCRLACMIHPVTSAAGKLATSCIETALRICKQMKIPALMLTSGFLCQIKNQKDLEVFSQHLQIACERAEDTGTQIVFESALSTADLKQVFQFVGKRIKICYDLFNPIRFASGNPLEEIPLIGLDRIDHFHTKDGPANMVGCELLGNGVGQYHAVMALLRQLGYSGWLVSENYYAAPPISIHMPFDEAAAYDLKTMRLGRIHA